MRYGKRIAVVLLILIGLGIYHNSLRNPLFWDDEETITKNVFVQSARYIPEIFRNSYHAGSGITVAFYRPLTSLTFLLDYHLWKLKPFGYHLSNILLHTGNAILIFLLFGMIFRKKRVAFLSALLFLVHPLNSEAVNYVSNRTDLLMLFFFLLSFWSYVAYRREGKIPLLALCFAGYICSVLSKEMGLVLPLFLLAYERIVHKPLEVSALAVRTGGTTGRGKMKKIRRLEAKKKRSLWPIFLVFAVLVIGYAVLRLTVLNFTNANLITGGPGKIPFHKDPVVRFLTVSKGFAIYLRLFFLPINLHMEYDRPVILSRWDLSGWLAVAIFCAAAALLFWWGRKARDPKVLFGASWFCIGLLPVSGIIVPMNNTVSEHYVYLSSAGFFLCVSVAAVNLYEQLRLRWARAVTISAGILLVVLLGAMTFRQNRIWSDPREFFLHITRVTTGSFRANNNAGMEYWKRGDMKKAEEYFRRSMEINPNYAVAVNNVGYIEDTHGNLEKAEQLYVRAVWLDPTYLLAKRNLANLYIRMKKYKQATEQIQDILRRYPYDQQARDLLKYIPSKPPSSG